MTKRDVKSAMKRKQEIANRIEKLQLEIQMLEREHREIINFLDLNKEQKDGQT